MDFKCEKCGNVEQIPDEKIGTELMVRAMKGWEFKVKKATVERMKRKAFKVVTGEVDKTAVTTLFVSTIHREALLDTKRAELDIFVERIVPVLEKIDENFQILGTLALPSMINLARTDLSRPYCVFTFVTVENNPSLLLKLRSLGLMDLLCEGAVDTIKGETWFGDHGRP